MVKSKLMPEKNIEKVKLINTPFDNDFHLFKTSFKKIQHLPALYVLIFSNGKYYIGHSLDVFVRLNQHYDYIKNCKKDDWHKQIHDYLIEKCEQNGTNFKTEFLENTTLLLQYTENKQQARALEKKALNEICLNSFKDKYYNKNFG